MSSLAFCSLVLGASGCDVEGSSIRSDLCCSVVQLRFTILDVSLFFCCDPGPV